jgi:hypothetical protein
MTAKFAATPYMSSGAVAPGFGFIWSSSDTEVAEVVDGLATGGSATGQATITAMVQGCSSVTCWAGLFNYSAVTIGHTRVVVLDELTQAAVAGATVVVGSEPPATTDENGMVELPVELSAGNPQDITVSKSEYDYATLKGVEVSDVIVSLKPLHHLDFSQDPPAMQAGGIKGKFDFGMIRCREPLKTCDVSFGMGGLSLPPSLENLGRGVLAKGAIMTEVELGGSKEIIKLPAGLVLCLNQTCFKEYFTPTGAPGNRVAWGFGGKLDLADLIDKLGPILSDGWDADYGLVARGLVPLFANFYTAMVPNVDVVPRPMVADVNDIDGDPATLEVPDYDNFPPQDMTLRIGMDQTMTFNAPTLSVGVYDAIVMRGGLIIRGAGFVPLGISLGVDSKDEADPPDGVIEEPIVLNVADVAGRIPEGQYQRIIVALAAKLEDDGSPQQWAGQVLFVDTFSGTHTLPEFMLPVEASYDAVGRRLEVVQVPNGAEFLQAVFAGENESSWHVLTEDFGSFDLPVAPPEGDRAESVGVYAVDLDSRGYQGLVEFNDLNMGNLIENLKAFSFSEVP